MIVTAHIAAMHESFNRIYQVAPGTLYPIMIRCEQL